MDMLNRVIAKKLYGGGGGGNSGGGSTEEEWIGDGNTHIWVTLPEGRISPKLGVGVNGTATVDWGDGSEPDVLTGTDANTVVFTPVHEYTTPGDYVITLSGGEINIKGSSPDSGTYLLVHADGVENKTSYAYRNAIQKVELGRNVTSISAYGFYHCYSLASVYIPDSVTTIGANAFGSCYSLVNAYVPSSVTIFNNYVFSSCYCLTSACVLDGVTTIGSSAFSTCYSLTNVHIPKSAKTIKYSSFSNCYSVAYYDFTQHTEVPTLDNTNAFTGIASDCEIRVPAALVDEWKAATNWSTYADYIVGV